MSKKTVVITSTAHKGGMGKTAMTVQLAAELANMGLSVLVVDMDPQCNASTHISKVDINTLPATVADLLEGKDPEALFKAIQYETNLPGVALISSSLSLDMLEDKIRAESPRPLEALSDALAPASGVVDVILIDTPPRLKTLTGNALACSTHYIVPVLGGSSYGLLGIVDLQDFVKNIQKKINPSLTFMGVLLNRYDDRHKICQSTKQIAEDMFEKVVPVSIPPSTKVEVAGWDGTSVSAIAPDTKISIALKNLAHWVRQEANIGSK